ASHGVRSMPGACEDDSVSYTPRAGFCRFLLARLRRALRYRMVHSHSKSNPTPSNRCRWLPARQASSALVNRRRSVRHAVAAGGPRSFEGVIDLPDETCAWQHTGFARCHADGDRDSFLRPAPACDCCPNALGDFHRLRGIRVWEDRDEIIAATLT